MWDDIPAVTPFYAGLVAVIREFSDLPITASPYLNGARKYDVSPDVIAKRTAIFAEESGIDVQIWQDSVGADAINVFGSNDTYSLYDYFAALRTVLPHFWSDNEAFNWGDDLLGGGYHPCSISRFNTQLQIVDPFVDTKVTWLQQEHFGSVSPQRFDEAEHMLAAYQALFGLGDTQKTLITAPYYYTTSPAEQYGDPMLSKLIDGVLGDPTNYANDNWVGVLGTVQVVFNVSCAQGAVMQIGWVSAHVLCAPVEAVSFPASLQLEASEDGGATWRSVGTWATPDDVGSALVRSEYVLGNTACIRGVSASATGTLLRLTLPNDDWTFLSEVEFVLVAA
eukprot:TRINITY_DN1939_c0_g1_i3.p1 TRINITY_DN1939_c0_g1~~TRINITY_DN1939_c0_g1_i3.p1  ORF type:complete len:337 (-),score=89.01 TRINITY_DN1939_c0_g1_i3:30-1040(-)